MTIVMGIAGNSGNQTMTLMIRSLALGHVTGVAVLYNLGRISMTDAMAAGPDLLLGALFIMAFAMTRSGAS